MNIGMISLGCDKNRVDAEKILANLVANGHNIVPDPNIAEIIIVNTCGFIKAAKDEAIDAILEMVEFKKVGRCTTLIVTGCLAQRYSESISKIDGVDYVVKLSENTNIPSLFQNPSEYCDVSKEKRVLTTPYHYGYIKIADGCNNSCSYCAIPMIRGKYISTPIADIYNEAKQLNEEYGVKELIVVAQDTTRYGVDLYGKSHLLELLDKLSTLDFTWIRLMYTYPEYVNRELIQYISDNPKICKYIDIPMQHINDRILKLMNRRSNSASIKNSINMIKSIDSDIAIRSSFIVGFPTETDSEYEELYKFVEEYKLQNAGFFAFSREEDTKAYSLKPAVPYKVKIKRLNNLRKLQASVIYDNNKKMVGKTIKVIYEGIDYGKQMFYGRSEFSAPDIDTQVFFKGDFLEIGKFYDVKITDCNTDLIGEKVNEYSN